MKYETIPYVEKPVSRILFGTAQPSFKTVVRKVRGRAGPFGLSCTGI